MSGLRLTLVLVTACVSIASPAYAQESFMKKVDIQKQIIGKSFTSVTEKGKPMEATFTANEARLLIDGTLKVSAKISYKGDDVICLSPGGAVECDRVRKVSNGFEFVDASTGKVHNLYKPK